MWLLDYADLWEYPGVTSGKEHGMMTTPAKHQKYQRRQQRFAPRKFREMVLYVARNCAADPEFNVVKLAAIMYQVDMRSYLQTGRSITGATYIRHEVGPVPKQLEGVLDDMFANGEIALLEVDNG